MIRKKEPVSSTDFQRRFGYWLDKVREGTTVILYGNKRPWMVLVPIKQYDALETAKRDLFLLRLEILNDDSNEQRNRAGRTRRYRRPRVRR
jgi:prevent-host-death family protein